MRYAAQHRADSRALASGRDGSVRRGNEMKCAWKKVLGRTMWAFLGLAGVIAASPDALATEPVIGAAMQSLEAGDRHACALQRNGEALCWGDYTVVDIPPKAPGPFLALSAGTDHTCGIRTNGRIVCWGIASAISQPPPTGTHVALSAGNAENCAIAANGALRCWGTAGAVSANAPTEGAFIAVSISSTRGCAIRADGSLQCWQAPGYASLGATPTGHFVSIGMGASHACALRSDGKAVCWGSNLQGQLNAPGDVNFVALSTGDQHACGIRDDGMLACWGSDVSSQSQPRTGVFISVTSGGAFTCARAENGAVSCWGSSANGATSVPYGSHLRDLVAGPDQVCRMHEDGTTDCFGDASVLSPAVRQYSRLSFGKQMSCGLTIDGLLTCWGAIPPGAPGGTFRDVSVGERHACALRENGAIACWGDDAHGQVSGAPTAGVYSQVVAGDRLSCAIRPGQGTQHALCWGQGAAFTLPTNQYYMKLDLEGDNLCAHLNSSRTQCWGTDPAITQVPAGNIHGEVAVGARHACSILSGYSIICWGDNSRGQLNAPAGGNYHKLTALGDTTCALRTDSGSITCWGERNVTHDQPRSRRTGLRGAAAGRAHACALRDNGGIGCWGDNASGQRVATPWRARSVAANGDHTCAILGDNRLKCWGDDTHAGSQPPAGAMRALDIGEHNGCAVASNGDPACWGWNENGQGTPAVGKYRSISTGLNHSCGLKDDGTLACWGYNADGQANAPQGPFRTVDVGERHSCALAVDGSLRCWGLDSEGQATVPDEPGATYRSLAVGAFHACAIRSEGGIACWGRNDHGQATPPQTGAYVELAAGTAHACALRDDGLRTCWGDNAHGQAPSVAMTPATLPGLPRTLPASVQLGLSAAGGYVAEGIRYQVTSGTLPYGLYLQTSGRIAGTPTDSEGSYTVTLGAVDENAFGVARSDAIVLERAPDLTPPVVQLLVNGEPATREWYSGDLQLTWRIVDSESTITATTGCVPATVTVDGPLESYACSATSEGGTTQINANIGRDSVPPVTRYTEAPPAVIYTNSASVRVRFRFDGTDDERSGVQGIECRLDTSGYFPCTNPFEYDSPLSWTQRTLHVRAIDAAGNRDETPLEFAWKVLTDQTMPVILGQLSGTLGNNGWYVSDVRLEWTVEDPESGATIVAGCVNRDYLQDVVSDDRTCTARSLAGEWTRTVNVKRDTAPPTITPLVQPAPNAAGWHRGNVAVVYQCQDATSGMPYCPNTDNVLHEGVGITVPSRQAVDRAGNTTESVPVTLKIDRTPPSIGAVVLTTPNAYGWYRTNVSIAFSCSDSLSGLASNCPGVQVLSQEGDPVASTGYTIQDNAGNSAQSNVLAVRIDKTPPTLTATMPPAKLFLNTDHNFMLRANDALSGIASQSCTGFSTATVGTRTVTCSATDRAGNTTSRSSTYSVEKRRITGGPLRPEQRPVPVQRPVSGRPVPGALRPAKPRAQMR